MELEWAKGLEKGSSAETAETESALLGEALSSPWAGLKLERTTELSVFRSSGPGFVGGTDDSVPS